MIPLPSPIIFFVKKVKKSFLIATKYFLLSCKSLSTWQGYSLGQRNTCSLLLCMCTSRGSQMEVQGGGGGGGRERQLSAQHLAYLW